MAINLDSIAELSGFSPTTVSRVLNGKAQVKPETREKILKAAAELNYRPNLLVRGLQTGRTGTIGVLSSFGDDFFLSIFRGVHDALAQQGCVPLLQVTGKTPDGRHIGIPEIEQLHAMVDRQVDGLIMLPINEKMDNKDFQSFFQSGKPVVFIDRDLDFVEADFVGIDDEAGGRLAVEYLAGKGHRIIGHIAGPDYVSTGRLRRKGFEEAARELGLEVEVVVDERFCRGEKAMQELLQKLPGMTAVFAANDFQAEEALQVINASSGVEKIKILGFGDLAFGKWTTPSLSTISQRSYDIGYKAAQLLLERLDNPEAVAVRKVRLQPEIIERESTR